MSVKNVSLPALRAFESAGRLGAFREAAQELNLSASAVSHAITALEKALGVILFERHHRSVRLTPDGEILMRHASAAFEEIRVGLDLVSAQRAELLRLHCAPSFAIQFLSPRLPKFLARNPGIEVKIAASAGAARFADGTFDADIHYGPPIGEDIIAVPLGEEVVTPLCTPEMAREITSVADLRQMTLIRSDLKRLQWPEWFALQGARFGATPGMSFDRSFLAIAAASNGLGIALESTRLAQPELESGRLVAPLPGRLREYRYVGHHLCYPKSGTNRRLVTRFLQWLLDEITAAPF